MTGALGLGLGLALLGAAAAHTLGVVVGAFPEWQPTCRASSGPIPACQNPGRRLRYADEDAWRFAYLLQARLDPEDILTFTQPDRLTQAHFDAAGLSISGAATLPDIVAGVRRRAAQIRARQGEDTPLSLVLYVSSHGSREGFHLEDDLYPYAALVEAIRLAADPQGAAQIEAVLSDACDSASASMSTKGSVLESAPRRIERADRLGISVYDRTDEVNVLQGGVLSYVIRSGLIGGADYDGDGLILARDMLDYLESYRGVFGSFYIPVVRARGSWEAITILDNPEAPALWLDQDPEDPPSRWLITVPMPGSGELILLGDLFLPAGTSGGRALRLPPGPYDIWRLPYRTTDGGAVADYSLSASGEPQLIAQRCRISLQEGASHDLTRCREQEAVDILQRLSVALVEEVPARLARGTVGELVDVFPSALPRPRPAPDYQLRWRNIRLLDSATQIVLGPALRTAPVPPDALLAGVHAGVRWAPRRAPMIVRASLDAMDTMPALSRADTTAGAAVVLLRGTAGVGRPFLLGQHGTLGGFVDGQLARQWSLALDASTAPRTTMTYGADLGVSATFSPVSWSVRGVGFTAEVWGSPLLVTALSPVTFSWETPEIVLQPSWSASASLGLSWTPSPRRRPLGRTGAP